MVMNLEVCLGKYACKKNKKGREVCRMGRGKQLNNREYEC